MNFEDWLESKGCMDGYGTDYQDAYDEGFDEGQQSQQAKIDCMQVRLDGANERALSILNHKNVMVDKMQAEIDAITKQRDSFIKAHHIVMNDVCEHKAKIGACDD